MLKGLGDSKHVKHLTLGGDCDARNQTARIAARVMMVDGAQGTQIGGQGAGTNDKNYAANQRLHQPGLTHSLQRPVRASQTRDTPMGTLALRGMGMLPNRP